ncbi:YoaK family protein [Sphingobacterium sp.]|uniref:YoaK family protein n=1 Tax=Sphingobacterium sp. TaxID=341027 RepID=UPI002897E138|nr:YoaK family protein [Sphingobacterium sp.]
MFRHRNKGRTFGHNIKLAALLSTVAGVVNIVGLLAFGTLTTNVTGHFAFLSEDLYLHNYRLMLLSIFYVSSFFLGAFLANTSMELTSKNTDHFSYMLPLSIEILFLAAVALSEFMNHGSPVLFSCILLLAMGLQNALVTKISGSVVRTTHLTGLFTDLGIELSQLIFYRRPNDRSRLKNSIMLRGIIITGFFLGGITGAFLFGWLGRKTLLLPIFILLFALYYDRILMVYYRSLRKHRNK